MLSHYVSRDGRQSIRNGLALTVVGQTNRAFQEALCITLCEFMGFDESGMLTMNFLEDYNDDESSVRFLENDWHHLNILRYSNGITVNGLFVTIRAKVMHSDIGHPEPNRMFFSLQALIGGSEVQDMEYSRREMVPLWGAERLRGEMTRRLGMYASNFCGQLGKMEVCPLCTKRLFNEVNMYCKNCRHEHNRIRCKQCNSRFGTIKRGLHVGCKRKFKQMQNE